MSQIIPEGGVLTNTNEEYTVSQGETLWSIAESKLGSGFKWEEIAKANDLTDSNIEVGQKLTIPTNDNQQLSNDVNSNITPESYTVSHGDSLWNIAVKVYGDGYRWVEIAKANNLVNPNVIHAGNVLTLPR